MPYGSAVMGPHCRGRIERARAAEQHAARAHDVYRTNTYVPQAAAVPLAQGLHHGAKTAAPKPRLPYYYPMDR